MKKIRRTAGFAICSAGLLATFANMAAWHMG